MLATLSSVLFNALAIVGQPVDADVKTHRAPAMPIERLDVVALGSSGGGAQGCRLIGELTLWVSRQVNVLDDTNAVTGSIEAGLAQFSQQAKLQGCVPGGSLDLSGRFVNFLVTDARASFGRYTARELAGKLARNSYRLAHKEGAPINLANAFESNVLGAESYRFTIVLIRNGEVGSYDAVIDRERVQTGVQ
jgi:hypothetical protein